MQSACAFVPELFRRLVGQRAVRSHRVVFAPIPLSFLPSVRHVLELFHLQELVPEPTIERLGNSVFPGARRRYRDRLCPLLRQPLSQRFAYDFRAVVAADALPRSPPPSHPSNPPSASCPVYVPC